MEHPAAIAGATLYATFKIGKFHANMAQTTPLGS